MNDWGFRNSEDVIDPKPTGALRIIAYGGSTTFLPNEVEENTWTYQLQQKLRQKTGNPAHQVLNGGVVLWSAELFFAVLFCYVLSCAVLFCAVMS